MSQSSKDPDKLKYVSLVNGRWVYRPYIPKKQRVDFPEVDKSGFLKPIKLGIADDPPHRILKAYAVVVENLSSHVERDKYTLRWIVKQYQASSDYRKLSSGSHSKHKTLQRILDHELTISGRAGTLGDLYINEISRPLVRRIREKRLAKMQSEGHDGKSQGNREISFLSGAVQWSMEMYEEVSTNPFRGLKQLTENVRDRYVTDQEYLEQLEIATEIADYLPVVMELTYLFAARGVEVTDILIQDTKLKTEGGELAVKVTRRKGSKTTFIKRNKRVDEAVEAAMKLHHLRKVSGKYLVPGVQGAKLNKSTLDDAMQRLKALMAERNLSTYRSTSEGESETKEDLFWTLHDLKRKGVSDADNKRIAGHKSEAMRQRYNVRAETFDAPGN